MLKKIKLNNYKCFDDVEFNIKNLVVLVGENNAGKSTIVEALRMVAYVSKKCDKTTYKDAPVSLGYAVGTKGIHIPVDKMKINLENIVSFYEDSVARVVAFFDDGCKIDIRANKDDAYGFIIDDHDKIVKTKIKPLIVI